MKKELKKIKEQAIKHIYKQEIDLGSCVLGCGIYVNGETHRDKGKKPFISHNELTNFQGDISAFKAAEPVIKWMNENHPELKASFDYGTLD